MHLNVYSNEGGIKSTEAGKKRAKDGKVYPFVAIYFENGNAIKFFGKTVQEVEDIVSQIVEAMKSLKMLDTLQTSEDHRPESIITSKSKVIASEFL